MGLGFVRFKIRADKIWLLLFLPALIGYLRVLVAHLNQKRIVGRVLLLNSDLSGPIHSEAKIEVVAEGFGKPQGLAWVSDAQLGRDYLLISDSKKNLIWKWEEGGGAFTVGKSVHVGRSGCRSDLHNCVSLSEPGSSGLSVVPQIEGEPVIANAAPVLLVCEQGEGQVSRLEADGTRKPIATHYRHMRLNTPKDIVIARNGDVYFTDIRLEGDFLEEDREGVIPFSGVYYLRGGAKAKQALEPELVWSPDKSFLRPQGITLSPSEDFLYIAVSGEDKGTSTIYSSIIVFKIEKGFSKLGVVGNSTELDVQAHATSQAYTCDGEVRESDDTPKTPREKNERNCQEDVIVGANGIVTDAKGTIYVAGFGGVRVLSPEGAHIGSIFTEVETWNVANGKSYLYIAAGNAVLRVRLMDNVTS